MVGAPRLWRRAALQVLAEEPADVVVADMQMPGMDGATLLGRVRDLYPTTIRMVLSGYASPQHLTRAAAVAHGFSVSRSTPWNLRG